jgi:alkanesulfonate monooxygenase SsuD/methylene tetrahydromethanopterin reductase-like flavin-dependent oxidoreductase (luciferase family)
MSAPIIFGAAAGATPLEDAILEPKPVQKPRPPVMIAGAGEQLTLRAVARLADACNVGGDPNTVRHKLTVLRGHCDTAQRDYATIETTHNNSWLLGRDEYRKNSIVLFLIPTRDIRHVIKSPLIKPAS